MSNHNGNANKMVSDTPRTNKNAFRQYVTDEWDWCQADFARQLERELNAANERIKLLEAVVNDPEALWTNWLRGTVKLPSGIGDVRQYQERIKRLEEAGDAMERWCDEVSADNWRKAKEAKP